MRQDDWGPWNGTQQNENQNMNQPPPPGYPPPGGGYPPGYPPTGGYPYDYKPPGNGLAIASMVLGILSLVLWITVWGYIIMAPLAIIFGAVARKKGNTSGMATAGIVMGIISLSTGVLFWVACGAIVCAMLDDFMWMF